MMSKTGLIEATNVKASVLYDTSIKDTQVPLPGLCLDFLTNYPKAAFNKEGKLCVAKVLLPNLDAPSSSSLC